MASIFTFDPDPPRVASPWSISGHRPNKVSADSGHNDSYSARSIHDGSSSEVLGEVTCLEAEPQSGPTEYKLHLLMRPRKSLSYTSTPRLISGSRHSRSGPSTPRDAYEALSGSLSSLAHAGGSRQHRLEQLTTQLLWRLQQSSPYHTTTPHNLILPSLPEAEARLRPSSHPAKLLSGLEESKGALYEIGVSDNGTFVGLTEDEMNESLDNLRAMAFSLGCSVKVLRMVTVGDCEWVDEVNYTGTNEDRSRVERGKLYVAEAYVKPILNPADDVEGNGNARHGEGVSRNRVPISAADIKEPTIVAQHKEQLRVSLTGATTCGKSSLLGTLSTSTLDNGRGKSRLSLLKHRHEIVSGMTSSVAQELIGYRDLETDLFDTIETQTVNYATGNVSSWDDIHASSDPGRLAFVLDSAGHPRYRRTTVRGLVGWVPHWVLLCIAANDGSDCLTQDSTTAPEGDSLDYAGAGAHISMAHLDICLRLNLPLVVVLTKMDVASKTSTRQVLSILLTTLKAAGRTPSLLSIDNSAATEDALQTISAKDSAEILGVCKKISGNGSNAIVPIVFTSAVKGSGVSKLHGLLRHLPIHPSFPQQASSTDGRGSKLAQVLFHVNDCFALGTTQALKTAEEEKPELICNVLSGLLTRGMVATGNVLFLGPFSSETGFESEEVDSNPTKDSNEMFLSPRSFGDALARATRYPKLRTIPMEQEWRQCKVVSIRNLRLPVRQLLQGQVGTLGIVFLLALEESQSLTIRKGMVLANKPPTSTHTFTARFDIAEASSAVVGSLVVVYCGSVRASAKVIAVSLNGGARSDRFGNDDVTDTRGSDDGFGFEFEEDEHDNGVEPQTLKESISVTFQFLRYREYLEVDSKVLVMPSGGQGIAGLEGFVGTVVDAFG